VGVTVPPVPVIAGDGPTAMRGMQQATATTRGRGFDR
jgi:hypothetical protein